VGRKGCALAVAGFSAGLIASRVASAQSLPAAPETVSVGDWQLAPSLEVRTRGEYRRDPVDLGGSDLAGAIGPRVRDAGGVFERARLGLGAEHGALRAQITLQDAHAWGAPIPSGVLGTTTRFSQIGAYEAFIDARTSSARPWFVRVGRQVMSWGDGRLVGGADWSPAGRALDAIRAHAPIGVLDAEAFASILDAPAPLGIAASDALGVPRAGAELYGVQLAWVLDPLFKIELVSLARVARGSRLAMDGTRFSRARDSGETYTEALRVAGDGGGWKYAVEGAYQLGRVAAGALGASDVDRRAMALAAYVSRRFEGVLAMPTLRLGGAYASGDAGGSTYKQFDPILPDVHTWHGAMDVFAWSNLVEGYVSAAIAPWNDALIGVEYRHARLADTRGDWIGGWLAAVGNAPQPQSEDLGHEVDVGATWRPWAALEVTAGYSVLLLGDGARSVLAAQGRGSAQPDGSFAPADLAHFAYAQATLRVP
jgi:hypothetical protein